MTGGAVVEEERTRNDMDPAHESVLRAKWWVLRSVADVEMMG